MNTFHLAPKHLVLVAICLFSGQLMALDDTLAQARESLNKQQAEEAWQLLAPLEQQYAGNTSFDYHLGRAALATQRNTHAAMAFERCLASSPYHGDCRLALAQTHIRLKENSQAKQELSYLQNSQLPPAVAEVVESYLDLLEQKSSYAKKQQLQAWIGLSLGYDDNLNAAPTRSSIQIPFGNNFVGTLKSKKDTSSFAKMSAGLSFQTAISQNWHFITGGQVDSTHNFSANDNSYFDRILQLNAYGGVRAYFSRQRLDMVLQGQNYQLTGDSYRNLYGALFQHSYLLNQSTQFSSFLQYSQLRYELDSTSKYSDLDSYTLGGQLVNTQFDDQLVLQGGLHIGYDQKTRSQASKAINNNFYGLRAGATWLWSDAFKTGVNLLAEERRYKGPSLGQNKKRKDNLTSSAINADYAFAHGLSLNAQYRYTHNHSNAAIRKYNRQQVSVGVRYEFF